MLALLKFFCKNDFKIGTENGNYWGVKWSVLNFIESKHHWVEHRYKQLILDINTFKIFFIEKNRDAVIEVIPVAIKEKGYLCCNL